MQHEMKLFANQMVAKYGLMAAPRTFISYSQDEAKCSITFKTNVLDASGNVKPDARVVMMLANYGLKIGDEVRSDKNGVQKIIGFNSRSSRYPVELSGSTKASVEFCRARKVVKVTP